MSYSIMNLLVLNPWKCLGLNVDIIRKRFAKHIRLLTCMIKLTLPFFIALLIMYTRHFCMACIQIIFYDIYTLIYVCTYNMCFEIIKKTCNKLYFLVQTLKYRDGCDRNRKSVCDIESPEKRLLEKEVSTWRGSFVFPMM